MRGFGYGPGPMPYPFGHIAGAFGVFMTLLVIAAVIALVWMLHKKPGVLHKMADGVAAAGPSGTVLSAASERYGRGEITTAEYQEIGRALALALGAQRYASGEITREQHEEIRASFVG